MTSHPGNVVVADGGDVTILDFGRSHLVTAPAHPMRAGVAYFYEPEMASALLAGGLPTPATQLGEQYSLAALLYHLITGVHYTDLPPEQEELLARIVERPPLPFTARGAPPWPAVEAVLAIALAKQPAQRFASVTGLLAAFDRAGAEQGAVAAEPSAAAEAAGRLLADAVAIAQEAAPAGAAGARDLAWFSLRAALAREDPDLLAAADVWACRAPTDWALEAVNVEIHRARGDGAAQARAAAAFLAGCERAGDDLDLLGGRSGSLVAAARVLDALAGSEADRTPLTRWVRETVEEIWQTVDGWGPVSECRELPHLGMAHGWAGLLYATLRACRATATPLPAGLGERLEQLAALARPGGRGACWVGTIAHAGITTRTPALAPGWCSGSAGHAVLWTLAHEELGDRRHLELAERAGRYAIDHPAADPDLCCGATGRGFALLSLYRATGRGELAGRGRAPRPPCGGDLGGDRRPVQPAPGAARHGPAARRARDARACGAAGLRAVSLRSRAARAARRRASTRPAVRASGSAAASSSPKRSKRTRSWALTASTLTARSPRRSPGSSPESRTRTR